MGGVIVWGSLAVTLGIVGAFEGSAEADPLTPESLVIVGRSTPGGPWTTGPTEARHSDRPELAVVVIAREGRRRVYVADDDLETLVIGGRTIPAKNRRRWADLGDGEVRWHRVEPHAWREDGARAPNGTGTRFHTNVSTDPASFGKWLGYDEVTYFETAAGPWSRAAAARRHPASAVPSSPKENIHDGLGTMRYRAELRIGPRTLSTPGKDATDRYGISPTVHRVSIRRDDTVLGYLTSYFLVPEVFGSAGTGRNHQTERFTGADCADVLTGAVRRAGFRRVWHTNVAGLTRYASVVAGPVTLDPRGMPSQPVRSIQRGDIIRIDYGGSLTGHTPRSWDHVALLYEDRSDPNGPHKGKPNGELDGFDLVVHMGHPRLEVEPLSGQSPAKIDVLRWSAKKMRRR